MFTNTKDMVYKTDRHSLTF